MDEECNSNCASDLKPKTTRNHGYNLLKYLKWARSNGQWSSAGAMPDDFRRPSPEERFKCADILEKYVKTPVQVSGTESTRRFQQGASVSTKEARAR